MNKIEAPSRTTQTKHRSQAVQDKPTLQSDTPLLPSEKKEGAGPEHQLVVVLRATANRNLVWAFLDGKKKDGPVRLRVRDSKFYRNGEQVMAYEVERDLWEAVEHRRGPRYGRMPD